MGKKSRMGADTSKSRATIAGFRFQDDIGFSHAQATGRRFRGRHGLSSVSRFDSLFDHCERPIASFAVFSLITGSAPLAPKVRCHRGHANSVFKAVGAKCRPAEQELHRARIQMDRLPLGRVLGPQAGMANRPCISALVEAQRPVLGHLEKRRSTHEYRRQSCDCDGRGQWHRPRGRRGIGSSRRCRRGHGGPL